MPNYQRTEDCSFCGDCCGANGDSPMPKRGWEAVASWSIDDINRAYSLWTLFGLGLTGEDTIGVDDPTSLYRITGKPFYYTWKDHYGKGTIPCKDTSASHNGSSWSIECPFLKGNPGEFPRECALVGSTDDGARKQFCRPEERSEYVPAEDIWDERSRDQWQADHPNCSYVFVEV